jgi:hypothetical protein
MAAGTETKWYWIMLLFLLSIPSSQGLTSQALTNYNFDTDTTNWTAIGGNPLTFSWVASDAPQDGIAQVNLSGANKDGVGSYYQQFNLTIPRGTNLTKLNFSVLWRIPAFALAGNMSFVIQNSAMNLTYCNVTKGFDSTTPWAQENLSTDADCDLGNFSTDVNYTFRMLCALSTGPGGASQEACRWDNASAIITYNDSHPPIITLLQPLNNTNTTNPRFNVTFNLTDEVAIDNCSLLVNNIAVNSSMNPPFNENVTFTAALPSDGIYFWSISCNDTSGNVNTTSVQMITRDSTPPVVFLNTTNNTLVGNPVLFNYTVIETNVANCSLWGNFTGTWEANQSNTVISGFNFFAVNLTLGSYLWNIECSDYVGHSSMNLSNYTLRVASDLRISNLTTSTRRIINLQDITLFANITNAMYTTETVTVQFWDGLPPGGTQIGNDLTVAVGPYGSNLTNTTWTATLGDHRLYVIIDPPIGAGQILEYDETNNDVFLDILVPIWQIFCGNVTGNVTLDTRINYTFSRWSIINKTGNIYLADADTTNGIDFTALHALGQNTSGDRNSNTDNDFSELDAIIGTASYPDNVNTTFTVNGNPKMTATLTVFGNDVAGIALMNTSNGNFTTGILWDTSDSANAYYDTAEDIVFITQIHNSTRSENGVVDYEIAVPEQLVNYKGSVTVLNFYYEMQ